MTQPNPPVKQSASKLEVDYTQEVRFAIVMYGGASLAIYMNGVAQEFLKLVRATAPEYVVEGKPLAQSHLADGELTGSEKVYRKIGQMLKRGEPLQTDIEHNTPISTRFMIDILSGTSAGGINAVFLAKALANTQDMRQLREMWVKEGDIALLLNDKESDEGIDLGQQMPPRSLLNSRRMYYKLLDALHGMDNPRRGGQGGKPDAQANGNAALTEQSLSPYGDEIDLFTTATDNWGQVINLRLADGVARERRHLGKFHFRYRSPRTSETERNDFDAVNNPFLAFAARCTSAHQSSFEPMKLADIDEALAKHPGYKSKPNLRADNKEWRSFYQTYLRQPDTLNAMDNDALRNILAEKFETRPFSDGGALDNSPFTFAIDQLQIRHADLPVERKLMYVEPVPEHPEEVSDPTRPPDAIENAWLALSVLPRYQFIREDLERLLERNRLVERVNRIVEGIERDEMIRLRKALAEQTKVEERLTWEKFCAEDIGGMIGRKGSTWGGYHRLRVAETTDEMEKIISQAAGFDPDSAESQAVRHLVRTWRMQNFDAYGRGKKGTLPDNSKSSATTENLDREVKTQGKDNKETENCFLYKYDLKWRVRRLKFVLKKIDEISCFDDNLEILLGISERPEEQGKSPATKVTAALGKFLKDRVDEKEKVKVEDKFRKALQSFKGKLNNVLREMVSATRTLLPRSGSNQKQTPSGSDELFKAFDKLKEIKRDALIKIAEGQTNEARTDRAVELLKTKDTEFDQFLEELNPEFNHILHKAAIQVEGANQTSVGKIGSSLFRSGDLKDRTALLVKLRNDQDLLSQYLRGQLLLDTQQQLAKYDDSSLPSESLQSALVNDLNQQLRNPGLFDEQRFAQVRLTEKARRLIEQRPQGEELIHLNRVLLEEAYASQGILEEITPLPAQDTPECIAARRALRYYYDNFDRYDMITYPLLYATSVGEEMDVVDVYRISPEDATRRVGDEKLRRRKLAGTSLGNFGAFFDERFRVNDILWGRLDCAERIITALLPTSGDYLSIRNGLIDEAHRAIIAEEFGSDDRAGISALLSTLMVQDQPHGQNDKFLKGLEGLLKSEPVETDKNAGDNSQAEAPDAVAQTRAAGIKNLAGDDLQGMAELQRFVRFSLSKEPKDPLRYFVDTYNFDHSLNPQTMVRAAGRASKVFGKLLEGIAETHRIDKSRVVWVTRLTQLFWALVEVAVPGSISNLVWRHWLKLLYMFEFLAILFGTFLVTQEVQHLGILLFAITVALHAVTLALGDLMRGEDTWWKRIKILGIILAGAVAVIGLLFFLFFFFYDTGWEKIDGARDWYSAQTGWRKSLLPATPVIAACLALLIYALRDTLRASPAPPKRSSAASLPLAEALQNIRMQLQLTPEGMAHSLNRAASGIDAQTIAAYERCAEQPSVETLKLYARASNQPLEELLAATRSPDLKPHFARRLLRWMSRQRNLKVWLVRGAGALALLFIVTGAVMQIYAGRNFTKAGRTGVCSTPTNEEKIGAAEGLPGNFKGHIIAMEFVQSKDDIERVVGDRADCNRQTMRRELFFDNYFFIPIYLLLFMALGVLLLRRQSHPAQWLGAVAIICGLASALFDFRENRLIGEVLARSLAETTDAMAYAIREAALLKWALSFVTIGALASIFFVTEYTSKFARIVGRVSGICFAAAAVAGFWGLWDYRLTGWTIPLSMIGLVGLIILSFKYPQALAGLNAPSIIQIENHPAAGAVRPK